MSESKPLWRYFANQFVSARQNFIDAAEATDGRLETLPISQLGPQDEQLSIDICFLGPDNPKKLLLHTSGVHGVEGYPGCAVQVKLLERWAAGELEVPDDCAIAVVASAVNVESNRLALAELIRQCGAAPRVQPLVRDTMEATMTALQTAFAECDAVVTSGGVSVGEHDHVKAAFENLGGSLDFWRVKIKPGKPFVFGRLVDKPLFGVPGNPVSALVTFLVLVRPALMQLQGAADLNLPGHPGILADPLVNRGDRRHFMRVRVGAQGTVHATGLQASHAVGSLGQANGLVDVPAETNLAEGETVEVLRFA